MEDVIRDDGRYPLEAFAFLHEGLRRAVQDAHGESEVGQQHVSGSQLCLALRDLAVERWGLLAKAVLARWRIRGTIDFGNMVYLLIAHNFMKKTEEDTLDNFRDVFDFDDAFSAHYEFEMKE